MGSFQQRCVSGFGRIGIIMAVPDPLQPNLTLIYTFFLKIPNSFQDIEYYYTYDADEKDKTM
jgi:hypothetical protein